MKKEKPTAATAAAAPTGKTDIDAQRAAGGVQKLKGAKKGADLSFLDAGLKKKF